MTNPVLRDFVCPHKVDKCTPDEGPLMVDIYVNDWWYVGEKNWYETIPTLDA